MTDVPLRREPPRFRRARVARIESRSPRLLRITLTGPELDGLELGLPAASVRLLLPRTGGELALPSWNGNEFLFHDGSRPPIRTLTPLRLEPSVEDPAVLELDVEVVRHGDGPLSTWADAARLGDEVAISGTGRGYDIDSAARSFLIAGDESALPAISTLLPALPAGASVQVLIEISDREARVDLPVRPGTTVEWCELGPEDAAGDALAAAVAATVLDPDVRVWAAGEAAAVQRIRGHLFDVVGLRRSQTVVRGYWKHGRRGAGDA